MHEREARKEAVGRALMARASRRRRSEPEEECADPAEEETPQFRGPKRPRLDGDGDAASICDVIRAEKKARSELELERLRFEREQFEEAKRDKTAEREARREELRAQHDLDLQKFKLMLEMFYKKDS